MKRISVITGVVFAMQLGACRALTKTPPKEPMLMENTFSSGNLVCQLTGPELATRKSELQKEVFDHVTTVDEMSDGYRFHFADNPDQLLNLLDYIMAERKCCPFFKHNLSLEANQEGIAWEVSGSPEVKAMLGMMMDEMGLR